ncbi:MAG TPA: ribonuclease D, partial [Rhodobacteraceae bacterium]|nr:ribonuclease D [Paracoccaceae bacterium]
MKTIYTTDELAEYCKAARNHPYVTIDTEFLRERTYYSKLCLIQMAYPGIGDDGAVLVDVLSGKMELDPLLELFKD